MAFLGFWPIFWVLRTIALFTTGHSRKSRHNLTRTPPISILFFFSLTFSCFSYWPNPPMMTTAAY